MKSSSNTPRIRSNSTCTTRPKRSSQTSRELRNFAMQLIGRSAWSALFLRQRGFRSADQENNDREAGGDGGGGRQHPLAVALGPVDPGGAAVRRPCSLAGSSSAPYSRLRPSCLAR